MDDCIYRIVVEGELGPRFAEAFESMKLTAANGQTEITGRVADHVQLHSLLGRIDDLGLRLISVSSDPET